MTTTYILTIRSLVRQMQQAKAAQLYPNNAIATTPLITATSSSSGPTSRKSSTLSVINLASGTGITVSPVVKKLKRCGSAIEASHGTMTIGQTSHPATGTQVLFRTHGKKLGSKAGLTTRPSLQVVIQVETGLLDMKAPGHSDVEGCLDRGQRLKRQMRSSLQPWIGLWPRLSITGVRHGRSDIGIPKSKASICEQRRTMANLTVPGSLTYSPTSEESSDWPTWRKRSTASVLSFAQQGQQQQPQRSALERIHRGQRAVQVIGVLFGVFLACYLPFFFVYLLDTLCEACQWWTRPAIPHTEWLGYLGSMLNPFVYHFFNPTFRRTFRRMMHCECRRRPAEYQAIWSAKAHQ
ncbi:unnamed protein product [Protopolystoma xenopodis]|uniref:G-protein coupled receptors family 1 profile domain-containing protein n=1 Tax=Protopolystoma xenopodis TaxID=117903 RepID=A0A448WTY9_9PLAT|nr:unnamed protein product [Protopolystoma xenopodis]